MTRKTDSAAIDTTNLYLVASTMGGHEQVIQVLHPGVVRMTTDQALNLAAWIVAMADPLDERFPHVLEAVRST